MARKNSRKDLFAGYLQECKQTERPEVVLLVAQDRHFLRVLVAWDHVQPEMKQRLTAPPKSDDERLLWNWLWENVTYSHDDLVTLTGLTRDKICKTMAVLEGNRIVYPDGTANSVVTQYMKTKVLALFRSRSTGWPRNGLKGKS